MLTLYIYVQHTVHISDAAQAVHRILTLWSSRSVIIVLG